nr:PLD nuclease N-terminal domain-containing protein [Methanosalsum zhilinae]
MDQIGIPLFGIFFFAVFIFGTIFWIWMLVDCALNEPSEGNDKLVWVVIIVFTHLIGALIYFLIRRPQRKRIHGR